MFMETMVKTKWVIDPAHSEVHFKVRHLVIATVTGSFSKFEGSAEFASDDFTDAQIEFSADVNSISTNQADRDAHLKSPDFFDAAKHPKITFSSKDFQKINDGSFNLIGDLTIKGHTRELVFDTEFGGIVKDPYGNTKAGFEITGKINRKDFGLTWNALTETGNMVVADDIKIQINIELVKQGK
jgi:polyisoprenoid-binding protein YceI